MFTWLRRHQPGNPLLMALYWIVLTVLALAVLFVLFYWLDNYLPGQGMF